MPTPFGSNTGLNRNPGQPTHHHRVHLSGKRNVKASNLSDHDEAVLEKVWDRARRLDEGLLTYRGVSFGWGSLIALIPG